MDYKDLANLIFPNAKEISYYEERYPERNLKERSNSNINDAVNADGPDHEGHGLEIAGVQGGLQEVGEVRHQHIGLGGHLSPLPSADGELVLGQAEIDKKREYAKHREQNEANPCLDRVIRKGFHQAVHPFLRGACLLNHKDRPHRRIVVHSCVICANWIR